MTQHLRFDEMVDSDSEILPFGGEMSDFSDADWRALQDLRTVHRFVGRGHRIMHESEPVKELRILCKGWALRSVGIDEERRQILDFLLPGDVIGFNLDGYGCSLCDVDALTACEVAEVDMKAVRRLATQSPGFSQAIQHVMTRTIAQANDQIVRLGRMSAYERVGSLFLDMYQRQRDRAVNGTVDFPITQTVAADALGLSVVHVNRQVMQLRREELVTLTRRQLTLHDPERLAEAIGYRDRGFAEPPTRFMAAE